MRKRYKLKKHSCGLCKPHKLGYALAWKAKDFAKIKDFENLKRERLLFSNS